MEAHLAAPPPLPPFNLGEHLLATTVLDVAALLIAAIICVALGVLARFRPRAATVVIETIRPLSMAVPVYVLGPLLLFIFVVQLRLFLLGASNGQLFDPRRLFLPALTLAVGAVALTLAQVRSPMFSFTRANGSWADIGLHLLGATLAGTFVVELIFNWPGIGSAAFIPGFVLQDLGTFWTIILLTMVFYLVVALPVGVATGFLAQRVPVTGSEPGAPGARRALPPRVNITLLSAGGVLVAALVLAIIFAPLLTPNDPTHTNITLATNPPSAAHPLGTDDIGRDILSRLLYSGRVSLGIGTFAVVAAGVSGLALGALVGLIPSARRRSGAMVDGLLMALTAFPALVLALALAVALHPGFTSLVVAFALAQVPAFMRLGLAAMRSRRRDTTDPSLTARGPSHSKVLGLVLAQASTSMALVILGASALTFFGFFQGLELDPPLFLGVHPPLFDWGLLISDGRATLITSSWLLLAPALALGICVLGFTVVGEALRSLLEERVASGPNRSSLPQAS